MYRSIGISKQGFHKNLKRHYYYQEELTHLVEIIRQVREDHPTMCCRSMYYKINPMFIGRDKFEAICREFGFTATPRRNYKRTTDSSGVIRFNNLLKDKELKGINEAWGSDITYFELGNMFYYITFIMDCYSRRILGHEVSARLLTEHTSLPAMHKAIKNRKGQIPEGIIFHSDGGGQYYDKEFLELTSRYGFKNSMCEYAYENGKSERLNGIIKNNYLRHWHISNYVELIQAVDRAVHLYNTEKPHTSLQRMTPIEYENNMSKLEMRNKSMMKESFDANDQIYRALSPDKSERNKSQNQDVISANNLEF